MGSANHTAASPDIDAIKPILPDEPLLILLDELVLYMDKLTDQEQGNFIGFLRALMTLASNRPRTVLVITDTGQQPANATQAAALSQLAQTFKQHSGRSADVIEPIGNESAQVIVRQLSKGYPRYLPQQGLRRLLEHTLKGLFLHPRSDVHVRFFINQQIKSLITTNVCELSFALPEVWVRFGLRLIVGAGPCDFGLRGVRGDRTRRHQVAAREPQHETPGLIGVRRVEAYHFTRNGRLNSELVPDLVIGACHQRHAADARSESRDNSRCAPTRRPDRRTNGNPAQIAKDRHRWISTYAPALPRYHQ